MNNDLQFEGKNYVSSKRAAQSCGYTQDYIGQLIRSKKIEARMVGRVWFVSEESLQTYKKLADALAREKAGIQSEQLIEIMSATPTPAREVPVEVQPQTQLLYSADERSLLPELTKKVVTSDSVSSIDTTPLTTESTVVSRTSVPSRLTSDFKNKLVAGALSVSVIAGGFLLTNLSQVSVAYKALNNSFNALASLVPQSNLAAVSEAPLPEPFVAEPLSSQSGFFTSIGRSFYNAIASLFTSDTKVATKPEPKTEPISESITKSIPRSIVTSSTSGESAFLSGNSTSDSKALIQPTSTPIVSNYITNTTVVGMSARDVAFAVDEVRLNLQSQLNVLDHASRIGVRNVQRAQERDVISKIALSTISQSTVKDSNLSSVSITGSSISDSVVAATSLSANSADLMSLLFGTASGTDAFIVNGTTTNATSTNLYSDLVTVSGTINLQSATPLVTNNKLYANGTDLYWAGNVIGGASTGNWTTNGTDAWRATGNVGVGTSTPWAQFSINPNGVSGPSFVIGSSTRTDFVVANGGKIGVGTSTPSTIATMVIQTNASAFGEALRTVGSSSYIGGNHHIFLQRFDQPDRGLVIGQQDAGQALGGNASYIRSSGGIDDNIEIQAGKNLLGVYGQIHLVPNGGGVGINTTNILTNAFEVAGGNSIVSTAKITDYAAILASNIATSTTASLVKSGLRISSTGTWSGAGSSNIGLYVSSVTGGTNNYDAIFNGGGYVGIGTTTPPRPFYVQGTSDGTIGVQTTASNNYTGINLFDVNSNLVGSLGYGNSAASTFPDSVFIGSRNATAPLLFVTGGASERMRITPTGNVGIGTTTPLRKLDIYSASSGNDYDFQLSNLFYNKGIKLGVDSANVPAIQGFIPTTRGATNLVLNAVGGNVGIGTTSPLAKLSVKGEGTTTGINFQTTDSNNASLITILDNGYVGIGTASPSNKLEVAGSETLTGSLIAGGGSSMNWATINAGGALSINAAGSIYSYTSICVSNASANCTTAGGVVLGINNTAAGINFPTTGNIIFNNGGNVGIGTTSPYAKLSVVAVSGPYLVFATSSATGATTPFFQIASSTGFQLDGGVVNPMHKGSIMNGDGGALLSAPKSVFVQGDYAYVVSSNSDSLEIVDISNPSKPVHKGKIVDGDGGALLSSARNIFVSGNYAYVAVPGFSDQGLEIVDVSDPSKPVHKGKIIDGEGGATLGSPFAVFVSGNYAYVTVFSGALEIIDISNPAHPVHKGKIMNGDGGASLVGPTSVVVSGNYAYVSDAYNSTLEIVDISNPAAPIHKGSLANGVGGASLVGPNAVAVSGNYAYVADAGSALEIVDISNPSAPVHKSKLVNGEGGAVLQGLQNIFVSGNYAYAIGDGFLEIVDISNPAAPVHKGKILNGAGGAYINYPTSVFVSGNYAYVTDENSSALEIIDVGAGSIANIQISTAKIGRLSVDAQAQFNQNVLIGSGLNVGGNTLLSGTLSVSGGTGSTTNPGFNPIAATFTGGNVGIGTTSPYALLSISATSTASTTFAIRPVSGQTANIIDIYNTNGTLGTVFTASGNVGIGTTTPGQMLSVAGDILGNRIIGSSFIATSTTATSTIAGFLDVLGTGANATSTFSSNLWVKGTLRTGTGSLYFNDTTIASANGGFAFNTTGNSFVNGISGNFGIGTTSPYAKLSMVSSTGPYLAFATSSVAGATNPFFQIASSTGFKLDGGVVNPMHKGSLANGVGGAAISLPESVFVSGNYAYIASQGSSALEIVDISNPAAPVHKGSLANGVGGALLSNAGSVFVSGNYAYVASGLSNALEIIDISNPAVPVHKGSLTDGTGGALLSNPHSVFVSGNYAYIASASSNALEIVDVSNPAAPVHKGSLTNGTGGALIVFPNSVFVSGNYAYIASVSSNALEIVDISNPSAPVHKSSLTNGTGGALLSAPYGVTVSGNYAYIASIGSSALEIVDISNPSAPVHKSSLTNGTGGALLSAPYGVTVSGNYAYVASNGSSAIEIVDISNPAAPVHRGSLANGTGGALLFNPHSVFVSGNYAYIASASSNALEIVDVGTGSISNIQISTAKVGNLSVDSFAQFNQNVLINSGLNVGGNTLLSGTLSVSGGIGSTTNPGYNPISATFIGGAVGIGTTSPYALLSISATSTASTTFAIRPVSGQTANIIDIYNTNGTLGTVFAANGYVGIGTSTPPRPFYVQGTSDGTIGVQTTASNNYTGINLFDVNSNLVGSLGYGNSAASTFANSVFIGSRNATAPLLFVTGGSNERMRITPAGNIGIGVTNPLKKIHLAIGNTDGIMMSYDDQGNYRNSIEGSFANSAPEVNYIKFMVSNGTVSGQKEAMTLSGIGDGVLAGRLNLGDYMSIGRAGTGSYVNLDTNSNVSLVLGTNVYIDDGEQLKNVLSHSDLSGAVIKIPGQGQVREGNIEFWTTPIAAVVANANYAQSVPRMVVDNNGKLGLGTTSPASLFTVVGGGACFSGSGATVACGNTAGNLYYRTANTGTYDVAENYMTSDSSVVAGDIVALDATASSTITKAVRGARVIGIVSTDPGLLLGGADGNNNSSSTRPVALSGRVPVKVNGENGNIVVGDRITLSSIAGVGRRAVGSEEVVGTALENWSGGVSDTGTVMVFVSTKQHFDDDKFSIDQNGNIGIGTTTPTYKLQVMGDIAATSFVNISTRDAKHDIRYLDGAEKTSILDRIKTIGIAQYRYNTESDSAPLRLGLIAEEAPTEVLAIGGKGVDVYKLSTFILAGVQEMQAAIEKMNLSVEDLKARMNSVESRLASLENFAETGGLAAVSASSTASTTLSTVGSYLASAGIAIDAVASKIMAIVTDTLTANFVVINKTLTVQTVNAESISSSELRVGTSTRSSEAGITILDRATGKPYCMFVSNGLMQGNPGECSTQTVSTPTSSGAPVVTPVVGPVVSESVGTSTPVTEPAVAPETTPAPVPAPELAPAVTPTPEVAPVSEPAPAPEPAPVSAPEPIPTP